MQFLDQVEVVGHGFGMQMPKAPPAPPQGALDTKHEGVIGFETPYRRECVSLSSPGPCQDWLRGIFLCLL